MSDEKHDELPQRREVSTDPERKRRAYRAAMVMMRGRLLTLSEAASTWRVQPWEVQLAQLEIESGEHPEPVETEEER